MSHALGQIIYRAVIDAKTKMTPGEVVNVVAGAAGVDRKIVKGAVKDLVGDGALSYTYVYGTSYLEPSFDRPVRVSERIVLKPPDKTYEQKAGEVVIALAGGAAFGNGAHPTTCLALRALDRVFKEGLCRASRTSSNGLDVGTGTGVLAIALARLGVQEVTGTDIDPCAVSEARHNVSLNGLSERITIADTPVEDLAQTYSVILANLACPTLKGMCPLFAAKMARNAILIVSGFKEYTSAYLKDAFSDQGLVLGRQESEREWVCFVLRKPVSVHKWHISRDAGVGRPV